MKENLREEFKIMFNTYNTKCHSFYFKINLNCISELLDFQIDFLSQTSTPYFGLDVILWSENNTLSKNYHSSYEKHFCSEMFVNDILFKEKIKEKDLLSYKVKIKNNADLLAMSLKEIFKEYNDEKKSIHQIIHELIDLVEINFLDQKIVKSECFDKKIENAIVKAEIEFDQFYARKINNNFV